jgi:hypothetical protein
MCVANGYFAFANDDNTQGLMLTLRILKSAVTIGWLVCQVLQMRKVAVLATHDIILTTLTCMRNPNVEISSRIVFAQGTEDSVHRGKALNVILGDDVLYDRIMPSFESAFAGRQFQRYGH